MDFEVTFLNLKEEYSVDATRFRLGYIKDGYFVEFHAYDDGLAEDTDPFITGFNIRSGIKDAYGIYIGASSKKRLGLHGAVGWTFVNTEFNRLAFDITDSSDFDTFNVTWGAHYRFTDHFKIDLDYVRLEGDVNYPTYVIQTGNGSVDAVLRGLSLGLTYTF